MALASHVAHNDGARTRMYVAYLYLFVSAICSTWNENTRESGYNP
jgi:hypothetical protein